MLVPLTLKEDSEVTVVFKFVFTAKTTDSPSSKEDLSDDSTIDVTVGVGGGVTVPPLSSEEHEKKKRVAKIAIKWIRLKIFIS
jgi:hypothetical protein|tara:strand:+ start:123 stop:371 length:249 start_codon:yes stop_codon:yes gene_type:complete